MMMTALKPIPNDLIDSLLANYQKPEDIIGESGLLKQLTKALIERALQAEMAQHLGLWRAAARHSARPPS
jgi:putative transposase